MEETESPGTYLKRERQCRNISLREVSRHTRIRERLLRALEEDRYDLLPSATFVKGFLTSYSKFIGLDPGQVLLRFERHLKNREAAFPAVERGEEKASRKKIWMLLVLIAAGMTGGVLLAVHTFTGPSLPPGKPSSPEVGMGETTPPLPPPVPPSPAESPPQDIPFSLRLKAVERTWIRIQVDDRPEKEIMLQPGEEISEQATTRIHLLVGNAGGLDLLFNGTPLERLGESGEVVTLVVRPSGVDVRRRNQSEPEKESQHHRPAVFPLPNYKGQGNPFVLKALLSAFCSFAETFLVGLSP